MLKMRSIWLSLMLVVVLSLSTFPNLSQQATSTPLPPGVTLHVVQRGENLYRIALNYGLTVDQIARVNGIVNTNAIQVGQRLLIPLEAEPVIIPPTTHTVQPGETLQTIAQFYGIDQQTLIQLNGIVNPSLVYVGQVLTIVPEAQTTPPTAATAAAAIPVPEVASVNTSSDTSTAGVITSGVSHVVQRGETLFSIAQRYGVTMGDLQAANNITNASVIYAGQSLVIPGTQPVQPTALLPDALTALDVTPLTLRIGKTGRVRLTTRTPSTVTATFLDQSVPVINVNGAAEWLVWLVVPLQGVEGVYPFALKIVEASGAVTDFAFNLQIEPGGYGRVSVNLPPDKVELVSKPVEDNEINIIHNITGRFNPERYFDGPMSLPAAAPMNGPFGMLRSYNGGPFDNYHYGADFAGAAGSPVLAAAGGRVVLTDQLNIRGTSVIIDHGWGIYTNYSHLSQRNVELGDFVTTGQIIGAIGSSGRATGAHLHWELWVNGVPVDPLQWVYQTFP